MIDMVANGTLDALVLDSYVLEYAANSRCDVEVVGGMIFQVRAGRRVLEGTPGFQQAGESRDQPATTFSTLPGFDPTSRPQPTPRLTPPRTRPRSTRPALRSPVASRTWRCTTK
jgi:hypothetical protein